MRFYASCNHIETFEWSKVEWDEFVNKKTLMWPTSDPSKYFCYAESDRVKITLEESVVEVSPDRYFACTNCIREAMDYK